jgi:predicted dehydrogenase
MRAKWGVLGSAGIAFRRTIPEGILKADNAALAAVFDTNAAANLSVAQAFGAKACRDEHELLVSDCDIIYVATPVAAHCGQIVRAAEAGKHVFAEKPLGLSVADAQRAVDACRENGVKLGVGFMMRFQSQHQEAARLIREGRLGAPVFARAQLSCWYPPIEGAWRQNPATGGGGSLMDMGGHCIDLLEMFFGRARAVCCMTARLVQKYPSEDTAVALLDFESGAKGVVDTLFNIPDAGCRNRLELYGSRGSLLAEGTIGQGEAGDMTGCFEEAGRAYDAQQARGAAGAVRIAPPPVNMYRAEVEAFSRAVLEGNAPPVDGEAGLWSQIVLTAAYESAATGKTIALYPKNGRRSQEPGVRSQE